MKEKEVILEFGEIKKSCIKNFDDQYDCMQKSIEKRKLFTSDCELPSNPGTPMYYFSAIILPFTAHPGDTITKSITTCLNPSLYFPDEWLECDVPINLVNG